jgi:type II secretory pathway pseudopilin PulG
MAEKESSLTIKWAVIIGIIAVILGGLFGGYSSNANRLTRLEAQYTFMVNAVSDLKQSQARVETVVTEIRYDQQRRQAKER